ncbi:bifunctional RNase H/acid phosphatase [Aeromicrobium sp. 636]|uniref:Bifunctional RNase H/acid phosphatase n=2 Tax=Nocardioidaceae TaxID=85015 RepID=A0A8I0EUD7_9ACTN|nr:bifunctional RNase H/acid phosphatase [Aeromicrobium senzhongii]MBC9225553.1 bifunctional RNase H/acid phosphatase [Aeromicrobium senzhongii]MCQ3997663.1 bifunctional RNase H/acid phosphatase [Aeromicrobium sp. 636]
MGWTAEADGGSRGNPGPASYGAALLRDGVLVADRGETIGRATNNVAEYRGLIAALELAREHAPGEPLEMRMDSKLVIEQMAGRWKIKHPDMKPLAMRAQEIVRDLGPVTWTWVPRAQNARADALANAALDAEKAGRPGLVSSFVSTGPVQLADEPPEPPSLFTEPRADAPVRAQGKNPLLGWRGSMHGDPTTVILLRHGVTAHTQRKLFSGSGGEDPPLVDEGVQQARRAADWIADHGGADAIVASPLLRTRQTAAAVAERLRLPVGIEEGFAEAGFGEWDGSSFAEIMKRWPAELDAWLSSTAVPPPGGESFDAVARRVEAARDRLLQTHGGRTVVVVSHVTPIKLMVRLALGADMNVIHRMELSPASITTIAWWPDGTPSLRNFSVAP